MVTGSTLEAISDAIKDESVEHWGDRPERLKAVADQLGPELEQADVDTLLGLFDQLQRSGVNCFHDGAFILAAAIVAQDPPWALQGLTAVQDWVARIDQPNPQATALVGSGRCPGIHSAFRYYSPHEWLRTYFDRSKQILLQLPEEDLIARSLGRLAWALGAIADEAWASALIREVTDLSLALRDADDRGTAIEVIVEGLVEWPDADWVAPLIERIAYHTETASEQADGGFFRASPKAKQFRALARAVADAKEAKWAPAALGHVMHLAETFSDDAQRVEALEALGEVAGRLLVAEMHMETIDSVFGLMDGFVDQSARAEAIGRFARELGDEAEPAPAVFAAFRRVIDIAQTLPMEERRAQALTSSVYSIAAGLAQVGPAPQTEELLLVVVHAAECMEAANVRAESLGDFMQCFDRLDDASWCGPVFVAAVDALQSIKDEDALSSALGDAAGALCELRGGPDWRLPLLGRIVDMARSIQADQHRVSATYGRHGIQGALVKALPEPWAREYLLRSLDGIAELVQPFEQGWAIKETGEGIVGELEDIDLASDVIGRLLALTRELPDSDPAADAVAGMAHGLTHHGNEGFQRERLFELAKLPSEQPDDLGKGRVLLGVIGGAAGPALSDIRDRPWAQQLFRAFLDQAHRIEGEQMRAGAIAASSLETGGNLSSIAEGVANMADATWRPFYSEVADEVERLSLGPLRFYAANNFAELAFGEPKLHERLSEAPWVKPLYLRFLLLALQGAERDDESWTPDQRESSESELSRRIHTLRSEIDAALPRDQREPVGIDLLREGLRLSDRLSETTYSDMDPLADEPELSVVPRVALLGSLLEELPGIAADETAELLPHIVTEIQKASPAHQDELWMQLVRQVPSTSAAEQVLAKLEEVLAGRPSAPDASESLVRALANGFAREQNTDAAMAVVNRLVDADVQYDILWNLACLAGKDAAPPLLERLNELADKLGKPRLDGEAVASLATVRDGRSASGYHYDVAISYAGPDRRTAEALSRALRELGVRVYFDRDLQEDLWGEALRPALARVYGSRAMYCLVLLSRHYPRSSWTGYELEVARARTETEGRAFVIPVRLDNTPLPGASEDDDIAYVELRDIGVDECAKMLLRRVLDTRREVP